MAERGRSAGARRDQSARGLPEGDPVTVRALRWDALRGDLPTARLPRGVKAPLTSPDDVLALRVRLASADDIRALSWGEVTSPETLDVADGTPRPHGLDCETIFGPINSGTAFDLGGIKCGCGKFTGAKHFGLTCDRCRGEVTESSVRRYRMGRIELAAPVAHPLFYLGTQPLAYLLLRGTEEPALGRDDLQRVIRFERFVVTWVDAERRDGCLAAAEVALRALVGTADELGTDDPRLAISQTEAAEAFVALRDAAVRSVLGPDTWLRLQSLEHPQTGAPLLEGVIDAATGPEAVRELLDVIDLAEEERRLVAAIDAVADDLRPRSVADRRRYSRQLDTVRAFIGDATEPTSDPRDLVLDCLAVLPAGLRPSRLIRGRLVTTDLTELYKRVVLRNQKLRQLLERSAPEPLVTRQRQHLQKAVDELLRDGWDDRRRNAHRASLKQHLDGKDGSFRSMVLGKRTDYSARSVIVPNPGLRVDECGLPWPIAAELFGHQAIARLEARYVDHPTSAAHLMTAELARRFSPGSKRRRPRWPILEREVQRLLDENVVLLNRAPTLHRLNVRAYRPRLVSGHAIHLHPLACQGFNADFDGDQMAVHLPLGEHAQAEAKQLLLASANLRSPATGSPTVAFSQDLVIGAAYLTAAPLDANAAALVAQGRADDGPPPAGLVRLVTGRTSEVERAVDDGRVGIHDLVVLRLPDGTKTLTTAGRALFNADLPPALGFVNRPIDERALHDLVDRLIASTGPSEASRALDAAKARCFAWASRSGVSLGADDLEEPPDRDRILAAPLDAQESRDGPPLDPESFRRRWDEAIAELGRSITQELAANPRQPLALMTGTGARGNLSQVTQLIGARGIVLDMSGKPVLHGISGNYRRGIPALEYFTAAPGARKGLADTAMHTGDAGWLTRRLVIALLDVVICRQPTTGPTPRTTSLTIELPRDEAAARRSVWSRTLAGDVVGRDGDVLVPAGTVVHDEELERILEAGVDEVSVLSPLTDWNEDGISPLSYGLDLSSRDLPAAGAPVGVIAGQSMGERGTQLLLRSFHTGGVSAGGGMSNALAVVTRLFEASKPSTECALAPADGTIVSLVKRSGGADVMIQAADGDLLSFTVDHRPIVEVGQRVRRSEPITTGEPDLHRVLDLLGLVPFRRWLSRRIQDVYVDGGAAVHDKHVEVAVRQMTSWVVILDGGASDWMPGQRVPVATFRRVAAQLGEERRAEPSARPILLGLSKAAGQTPSWLANATFQAAAGTVVDAALRRRVDPLRSVNARVMSGKRLGSTG